MRIKHILLAAITIAAVTLTSCHSSKQGSVVKNNHTQAVSRSTEVPSVASALLETRQEWTDVQLPVSIKLSQPASVSLNATAYMRRGEYIKFSVRMLGFEVATAWIDTDSVHAIDKVGKRYVSESISRVTTELGLDIADVQDILLGRVFRVAGAEVAASDFKVEATEYENMLLLRPAPQPEILEYGFVVSADETPLLNYLLVDAGRFNAVAQYSGQENTAAGTVARRVSVSSTEPRKIAADLTWNLSSAKWNRDDRQKWQAPGKGYTKISLSSLLAILKKL